MSGTIEMPDNIIVEKTIKSKDIKIFVIYI